MNKSVKAEIWKITLNDGGVLGISHSWCNHEIIELFIPSHNISFNSEEGWNCFETTDCGRYGKETNAKKIRDIVLPDDILSSLTNYIEERRKMEWKTKNWFDKEVGKDKEKIKKDWIKTMEGMTKEYKKSTRKWTKKWKKEKKLGDTLVDLNNYIHDEKQKKAKKN